MNHLFDALRAQGESGTAVLHLPDGTSTTYGALWQATARAARFLRQRGVQPGDRVALQAEKHPLNLALYLATLRAGAIFVPLNTAYTAAEVDYFLSDTRPRVFICDPARRDELAPVAARHGVAAVETLGADGGGSVAALIAAAPDDDNLDDDPDDDPAAARGEDDVAAILYTSGTTGRPKGAMLSHGNLLSNAATLKRLWRFDAGDVLLHALPIYHAHGLFVACNVALLAGAGMLFLPRFDADAVLSALPRASAMMGVPTFYTRLLQHPRLGPEVTASMRLFISGSAPLLAEHHQEWQRRTGHVILERYGMTETTMITSNPYDGERIPGSVGLALDGVDVRVVDRETGAALATGGIGIVEVKGPNVFRGYWNKPVQTAEVFRPDGYFTTGDLGVLDARGYLRLVGRDKDLVISGGLNVYPTEVEAEIDAVAGVAESAVIGLPHRDFGEAVAAVVVRSAEAPATEADIATALKARLAGFKLPKRIFFVDELPRNALGKVQKNLLRDRYRDTFAPAD